MSAYRDSLPVEQLPAYDEAIQAAGECIAEAELAIYDGTVAEAARRAYTPTGPPIPELEARIADLRAGRSRAGDESGPTTPARAASNPPPVRQHGRDSRRAAS